MMETIPCGGIPGSPSGRGALAKELLEADDKQEAAEAPAEKACVQAGGSPGAQTGGGQPGKNGGEGGGPVYIAVFDVAGESRRCRRQEVDQIDALGQVLLHSCKGGEVEEKQGAAAHPEAGEDPRGGTGQEGDKDAHRAKRDRMPP